MNFRPTRLPLGAACAAGLSVAAIAHGQVTTRLVSPMDTDPNIIDVHLPNADGFARDHVVSVDPRSAREDRLFLFLPGSGGSATQTQVIVKVAAELGYDAIGLIYDSWPPVYQLTSGNPDPELPEAIRRERIFGEDLADDIDIDEANSITNRVVQLLRHQHARHPEEGWDAYLTEDAGVDWSKVVVSGHSQGAGHAAYLTKQFELEGAVLFAGPGDFVQGLGSAPWLFLPQLTPPSRMFAFTHVDDRTAAGFFMNQRVLELDQFGSIQSVDRRGLDQLTSHMLTSLLDPGHTNYHSAVVVDELLPRDEDGELVYLHTFVYMLGELAPAPITEADPPATDPSISEDTKSEGTGPNGPDLGIGG